MQPYKQTNTHSKPGAFFKITFEVAFTILQFDFFPPEIVQPYVLKRYRSSGRYIDGACSKSGHTPSKKAQKDDSSVWHGHNRFS